MDPSVKTGDYCVPTDSRNTAAAKRFFQRLLAQYPNGPRKIVTGRLRSYPAAKAELPALAGVKHVYVKADARLYQVLAAPA